jgi:hypothetical protein
MGFKHISGIIEKLDYSYAVPNRTLSIIERGNIRVIVGIMGELHIDIVIHKDGKMAYKAPLSAQSDEKWKQVIAEIEKDTYYCDNSDYTVKTEINKDGMNVK